MCPSAQPGCAHLASQYGESEGILRNLHVFDATRQYSCLLRMVVNDFDLRFFICRERLLITLHVMDHVFDGSLSVFGSTHVMLDPDGEIPQMRNEIGGIRCMFS